MYMGPPALEGTMICRARISGYKDLAGRRLANCDGAARNGSMQRLLIRPAALGDGFDSDGAFQPPPTAHAVLRGDGRAWFAGVFFVVLWGVSKGGEGGARKGLPPGGPSPWF